MKKSMYLFFLMTSILKKRGKNTGLNVGLSILLLTGLFILLPPFSQSVTAASWSFVASADTFTSDANPTMNFGSEDFLFVGHPERYEYWTSHIYFDISWIPVNSEIVGAWLHLYQVVGIGTHRILVQQKLWPWSESTLTSDTPGAFGAAYPPLSVFTSSNQVAYHSIDVTQHVQSWVNDITTNGGLTNNGFYLHTGDEGEYSAFISRERGSIGTYPSLEIIWNPPCDSAIVIPIPIGGRGTQIISGNTSGANNDAVSSCRPTSIAPDDIYVFTLYRESMVTASVTGFDTVLHLREVCDDPGSELACNDDINPPGDLGSLVSEILPPGEYYLIVDGYESNSGAYELTVDFKGSPCISHSYCDSFDYCYKEACDDALGTCESQPFDCGILPIYDPVCGCDGITYTNSCYAGEAGVSVDYEGECISMDPGIYGNISGAVQEGVYMLLYSTSCGEDTYEGYVLTAADGSYSITGLSNGSYKVKPLKSGYTFSPSEQILDFNNNPITGVDFTSY